MKRKFQIFAVCACALALSSGCSFSLRSLLSDNPPEVNYFVLGADATFADANANEKTLPRIPFARISIPSYLDVPQLVTRDGSRVERDERNRWGEPLVRAFARELELRSAAAFAEKNKSVAENKRVRVSVERFDGAPDGSVELAAVITIETVVAAGSPAPVAVSKFFKTSKTVGEPNDGAAYVVALDAALSELARAVADSLE